MYKWKSQFNFVMQKMISKCKESGYGHIPGSSHYCTIAFGAKTWWCDEDGDWHDDYDTML